MIRKALLTTSLAAGLAMTVTAPAHATWGHHKPGCKWGKNCGGTSGGNTSGGNTSGGNTSGGNTSGGNTSGGTKVPEPGMLGLMGVGLVGLAVARRKSARKD
ncbi:PEP-CTERM sorting domain-containing protein [Novosphingobium sp. RD2P27]|uniref:PEP-CTERM sorting domain-containing protein n=1 Tax=Novosphingobium kalidii TaxID=3230299 RepID=A0ABV2D2G9_9SPHN